MSTAWYDGNAESYALQTLKADMTAVYARFLPHLPRGGRILDAGCGGGRDSNHFLRAGYEVDAFDASAGMVLMARNLTGLPVKQASFEEFEVTQQYDGIWACASLLHVGKDKFQDVLKKLLGSLTENGVFYFSMKAGDGERIDGERYFHDMLPAAAEAAVLAAGGEIVEIWTSGDKLPGRPDLFWTNVICRRS